MTWSSVAPMTRVATTPSPKPMSVLIATVATNVTTAASGVVAPPTAPTAIVKITTAVPSLNRLSASTSVARRPGACRWRNVAMTATGSVADTIAPTRNAEPSGTAANAASTTATTPAEIRTPGTARSTAPRNVRRSSSMSRR